MAEIGESLSDRELDVLRCVAEGSSNKEIASALTISQNTVKVHLRNIYTKLGVSSRTEATTAGMQQGYITILDPNGTAGNDGAGPEIAIAVDPGRPAVIEPENDAAAADESDSTSKAGNWRVLGLVVLLIASAIAIAILGVQVWNQNQTQAAIEPFSETALGDSRWLISKPMPEGRANMAVAAVGLDIYQIGGETAAGIDGKVNVFDTLDRTWRAAAEKPTAVSDSSAVQLYGEIYVPGGLLIDGQPTDVVEAYSPSQDAWRPIAALPQPVSGGLAITDGAFLYLFGGWDGQNHLDTAFVYDPSADSWRPLPPMPVPLTQAAGGALAGQLIVTGGEDGKSELSSCFTFDLASDTWSSCPDMLRPRASAGSAVILNKLYIIGGGISEDNEISFSEVYDPATETWQVVNTPTLKENPRWPGAGVGQIETRIYALGGQMGDRFLDETLVYAPLVYQTFIPAASSGDDTE